MRVSPSAAPGRSHSVSLPVLVPLAPPSVQFDAVSAHFRAARLE